ncbi:MAG TPA: winged helix DNA-binding domain-containing protein [Bryobacteraceae bacterium]|nr:winged helix DNA-binding domain-containing protein [Bryobacteraceae bacterium]
MNNAEIVLRRLSSQRLWTPTSDSPEAVVHHFGAMQSQEFGYAKWSIAQRAVGVDVDRINQALASGTILRTHMVRPTWHFVAATDIRWMLTVTGPRVNVLNSHMYNKVGLDDSVFSRSRKIFTKALMGGKHLTRSELAVVLQKNSIKASGFHLAYIIMRAELDGIVCSGPLRGKQQTYALLDERVPSVKTLDREEGLIELTRRYFTSRGPATLKDYLVWSSLTAAEGRRGLEAVTPELHHESIDDRTYWLARSSESRKPAVPVIDLVQGYDEYIMSYSESRDLLHLQGSSPPQLRSGSSFLHVVLLDGRVIGRWRRVLKSDHVVVEVCIDRSLKGSETQALGPALERYGHYMGLPVELKAA